MRLVLVDAANCIYRAFFALPPLRTTEGFPTGALHGFAPALAAAICDAVGLRPRELPVTPDRLFEALHARRRRERVRARRVEPEQAMP